MVIVGFTVLSEPIHPVLVYPTSETGSTVAFAFWTIEIFNGPTGNNITRRRTMIGRLHNLKVSERILLAHDTRLTHKAPVHLSIRMAEFVVPVHTQSADVER